MQNFKETYADGLACRWAAKQLELPKVDSIIMEYNGGDAWSSWTYEDSFGIIYADAQGVHHRIDVDFGDVIRGMIDLAAEEQTR